MALAVCAERLRLVVSREAADGASAAGSAAAAAAAGRKPTGKDANGADGAADLVVGADEGRPAAACWLRCSWPRGAGVSESWRGVSRRWRNTHPRLETPGLERTESNCAEEAPASGGAPLAERSANDTSMAGTVFQSERWWLQESARLSSLNEASLTAFANAATLRVQVYAGAIPAASEEDMSSLPVLAEGELDISDLLNGRSVRASVQLLPPGDDERILSASVDISVSPDEAFVDYVLAGHILTLSSCQLDPVPPALTQPLLPAEKKEEPREGILTFSPEEFEAMEAAAAQAGASIAIALTVPTLASLSEQRENDIAQSSGEPAATEEDPTTSEVHEAQMSATLRLENLDLRFDMDRERWFVSCERTSGVLRRFISDRTARELRLAGDGAWSQTTLRVEMHFESANEGLGDDDLPSVEFTVGLEKLASPGERSAKVVGGGCVAVEVSLFPPLATKRVNLGEVYDLPQTHKLVRMAPLQHNGLRMWRCSSRESLEQSDKFDTVRLRALRILEEEATLISSLVSDTENTPEDVFRARLLADLFTTVEDSQQYQSEQFARLERNASEAEMQGAWQRCAATWYKCLVLDRAKSRLGFARFLARRGRLWEAIALATEDATPAAKRPPLVVCDQTSEALLELEESAEGILALLEYEAGKHDRIDLSVPELTTVASAETKDLESSVSVGPDSADEPASKLRQIAKLALDLNLVKLARTALIRANAADATPLLDERFVENELLRARFKLLEGRVGAARAILRDASQDSPNASVATLPGLLRAEVLFYLGSAAAQDEGEAVARGALSGCMAALNELDPVAEPPRTKFLLDDLRLRATQLMAGIALRAQDARKARVLYRNATQLVATRGNLCWAWLGLGEACRRLEEPVAADRAFKQAIVLDDCCAEAWGSLARLQLEQRNLGEALPAVELALSTGLGDTNMLRDLSSLLENRAASWKDLRKRVQFCISTAANQL